MSLDAAPDLRCEPWVIRAAVVVHCRKRCYLCGAPLTWSTLTLDHVVPQLLGGPSTYENLAAACRRCNFKKEALTLAEFYLAYPLMRPGD